MSRFFCWKKHLVWSYVTHQVSIYIFLKFFCHACFCMAQCRDTVFLSICLSSVYPFVCQSISICVNPNLDSTVQVHFPRTVKTKMMILGISLHSGMTTQTAVSIFDLDLYFMAHRFCQFAWRNIALKEYVVGTHLNCLLLRHSDEYHWHSSSVGKASALWPGGCRFDPRPSHTKDFKNGASCSFTWHSALKK